MLRHRCPRQRRPKKMFTPQRVVCYGVLAVGVLSTASLVAGGATEKQTAFVVPIRGEISDIMRDSIARRLDQARSKGAKTIIFEMDTPGGLVTSALDICRMIKKLPDDGIRTVAWVHDDAYSAGAMISVACQQIVMTNTSHIGDCAPIMYAPGAGVQEMPAAERAKAESPVLAEFRDSANRNGYNRLLLRAMVTVGEEVWWVENVQTGERQFVNTEEKDKLFGEKPLFGNGEAESQSDWRLVESYINPVTDKSVATKKPVDAENELLTIDQGEAVAYGIASGIAPNLDALTALLDLPSPPAYKEISGWEKFVMWLNSPIVRGILFVIVLLGAYIEFHSPGLILPGATAAVALLIFLGAPYAAGLADVWTFVLLALGVILLAIEIFLIPGFGVTGILGLLLIGVAIIGSFVPSEPVPADGHDSWWDATMPSMPGTWEALKSGILYMSASVIVAVIGIVLIIRFLPQLAIARVLIPENPDSAALALADTRSSVALVGEVGIVTGDLRPGGQARFGQEIVDVRSQGEYVEAGRRVQVIKHDGIEIFVRPLPDDADRSA